MTNTQQDKKILKIISAGWCFSFLRAISMFGIGMVFAPMLISGAALSFAPFIIHIAIASVALTILTNICSFISEAKVFFDRKKLSKEGVKYIMSQHPSENKYEQKAQFYAEIAGYDSTNRFAFQDNRYIPLHIVLFFETATLTALTLCCAITSSAFGLAASGAFIAPVVLLSVLLLSSIGEYISGLYLRNTISKEVPRFLESPALRNCENDEKILRFSRIYDKYKSVSI